jgi:hypothetical protein
LPILNFGDLEWLGKFSIVFTISLIVGALLKYGTSAKLRVINLLAITIGKRLQGVVLDLLPNLPSFIS